MTTDPASEGEVVRTIPSGKILKVQKAWRGFAGLFISVSISIMTGFENSTARFLEKFEKADSFAALRNDMQKSKGKDGAGLCAFPPIAKTRR